MTGVSFLVPVIYCHIFCKSNCKTVRKNTGEVNQCEGGASLRFVKYDISFDDTLSLREQRSGC